MIDAHAHIQFGGYDEDREAMLERAWAAGLESILVIGSNRENSRQALKYARSNPKLYAVLGYHPQDALEYNDEAEAELREMLQDPRAVAVGEIGLDYHEEGPLREIQHSVFRRQLDLALELNKPVVVHSRDAESDTLNVLEDYKGRIRGQIHCFSYDALSAAKFVALGFHVSFCGPITFKNGQKQREASLAVPIDRLLVETDCPYMAPTPYRGQRNEPAYVVEIARAHAILRQKTLEEMDAILTANTKKLFGI